MISTMIYRLVLETFKGNPKVMVDDAGAGSGRGC